MSDDAPVTHAGDSGAEILISHLVECTDAQAAIVVDGSADDTISKMAAAGWVLSERVDYVAGKRVRFMMVPGGDSAVPPSDTA